LTCPSIAPISVTPGDRDPDQEGISKKRAGKLIEDLVGDVAKHIAEKLLPALRAAIAKHLGEPTKGEWSLQIDASDPQTVNFHYPTALSKEAYEGMAYITPRVKLEFGARGDPWPTEEKTIRPYAADDFPGFFEEPDCTVTVLSARRTFWEKATALQAEAHRPKDSPTPQYFSRHYYDIAMLLDTEDGKAAAADFELLEQVAKHKTVFFRSGWAGYDTARPGTLQLMPSEARLSDLRADYRDMAPMMFDDKPLSFDESLARVQKLQDTINASTSASQQPAPLTTPRHATPRAGVGRQRRKIQGAAHGGFAYSISSHSRGARTAGRCGDHAPRRRPAAEHHAETRCSGRAPGSTPTAARAGADLHAKTAPLFGGAAA